MDASKTTALEFIRRAADEVKAEADPVAALEAKVRVLWDSDEDDLCLEVGHELERLGMQRAIALARQEAKAKKYAQSDGRIAEVLDADTRAVGPPLEWRLPNGAQLGAANMADISHAIARHKIKAEAHIGWVKFYSAVKAKMLAAKVYSVGELFSEPELLKISAANGVEHPPSDETGRLT